MSTPEPPVPVEHEPSSIVGLEMYSGPLPPPELLAAYERAHPGMAERIINMAEREQGADIRSVWFEQCARFVIDLIGHIFLYALVAAAVFLAINDKPLEAFLAGLAPIVVAIYANTRKPKSNSEPRDD